MQLVSRTGIQGVARVGTAGGECASGCAHSLGARARAVWGAVLLLLEEVRRLEASI